MVPNQYSLTWDSYKSSICGGFSSLQQNGEFVDMTLAADGHLVKVHQVLIALASPYLKELINSVPSQHPVIFLNNVSHATLGLLLEYVYTGEVLVPAKYLQSFMEAAKALHIKGLENVEGFSARHYAQVLSRLNWVSQELLKMNSHYYSNMKVVPSADSATLTHTKVKRGLPLDIHSVQTSYDLPTSARKISVRAEPEMSHVITMKEESDIHGKEEYQSYSETVTSADNASDDDTLQSSNETYHGISKTDNSNDNRLVEINVPDHNRIETQQGKVSSNNLQFTVSIRGSLQVILNRYMYNLQSTAHQSGVKRWRCIDYRNKKCPAALVTKGNIVLSRACPHSHTFHDKKILTKIEKNAVYSALDEVVGYKEKERRKSTDDDWQPNSPGFISLDCDSDTSNSKSK